MGIACIARTRPRANVCAIGPSAWLRAWQRDCLPSGGLAAGARSLDCTHVRAHRALLVSCQSPGKEGRCEEGRCEEGRCQKGLESAGKEGRQEDRQSASKEGRRESASKEAGGEADCKEARCNHKCGDRRAAAPAGLQDEAGTPG